MYLQWRLIGRLWKFWSAAFLFASSSPAVLRSTVLLESAEVYAAGTKSKAGVTESWEDNPVNLERQITSIFSRRVFDRVLVNSALYFSVSSSLVWLPCMPTITLWICSWTFSSQEYRVLISSSMWKPALFSIPLMSTSNSLSGVVILGGMFMASLP